MKEGCFSEGYVPVVSHALDIPQRLKALNEGYFVMLNVRTQHFEVWHEGGGQGILECVLPYEALDERAIRHVREHRIERMEALAREVDEYNRKLEEQAYRNWLEQGEMRMREAFNYLKNKSILDEIPKELINE